MAHFNASLLELTAFSVTVSVPTQIVSFVLLTVLAYCEMLHICASALGFLCFKVALRMWDVSFVYITVNPTVLSHSCVFLWLRM